MKRFLLCFVLLLALRPARALDWNATRGDFTYCLLQAHDGFWVGTENDGLWRRDARGAWKQFNLDNGLGGQSVRCLLERGDQIWAGHGRDGLSIWDGATWHRVGVDEGLPSARVNDLALDSASGDVWVATENGLCRWNDAGGWTMPASPLTRRQIVALACARGQVWAATACDGLLKSSDRGQTWAAIQGAQTQPVTATGTGLPSEILNDVAVDELGQIWVASDYGLAKSSDEGASWFFLRGADWRDNVAGSAAGLKPQGEEAIVEALGEDWVQTLATDGAGHLWLGFRQQGAEMRDIQTDELLFATRFSAGRATAPDDIWVRAIAPTGVGQAILARYGGGLDAVLKADFPAPLPAIEAPKALEIPGEFPVWDAAQIARVAATETATETANGAPSSALWDMDYRTRGDWVGRYGDSLASVYERPWEHTFRRDARVELGTGSGFPVAKGASPIYAYIAYLSSDNPDVLYNPAIGTRRLAEINDGTWQDNLYPFSHEGPGLWFNVTVPAGAHRVALYFYNAEGHDGHQRYRDYVLQLKPFAPDVRQADAAPDLARCRVSDFQSGVYASFAVSGPGHYWVKIARHRSNVTKTSGIFIDRIGGQIANPIAMPSMRGVDYYTQPTPIVPGENPTIAAARAAWQSLDQSGTGDWQSRHQLLRAARAAGADESLLFNWRWKLGIWSREDRETWGDAMAQIENKRAAAKFEADNGGKPSQPLPKS